LTSKPSESEVVFAADAEAKGGRDEELALVVLLCDEPLAGCEIILVHSQRINRVRPGMPRQNRQRSGVRRQAVSERSLHRSLQRNCASARKAVQFFLLVADGTHPGPHSSHSTVPESPAARPLGQAWQDQEPRVPEKEPAGQPVHQKGWHISHSALPPACSP
jgi:hypothetical protein